MFCYSCLSTLSLSLSRTHTHLLTLYRVLACSSIRGAGFHIQSKSDISWKSCIRCLNLSCYERSSGTRKNPREKVRMENSGIYSMKNEEKNRQVLNSCAMFSHGTSCKNKNINIYKININIFSLINFILLNHSNMYIIKDV